MRIGNRYHMTDEKRERLREIILSGEDLTQHEIAERLGVTQVIISLEEKKLGIRRYKKNIK